MGEVAIHRWTVIAARGFTHAHVGCGGSYNTSAGVG